MRSLIFSGRPCLYLITASFRQQFSSNPTVGQSLNSHRQQPFPNSCTMSAFVMPAALPRARNRADRRGRAMACAVSGGKTGVLMLCLGNICRSPAAEAVMRAAVEKRGLGDTVFVDSCGTGGGSPDWYKEDGWSFHKGDPADPRMRQAAEARGMNLTSRSRPLQKADFVDFDVIVAMDSSNLVSIGTAKSYWGVQDARAKVVLMSHFSPDKKFRGQPVPDPYYGGEHGFEHALDLIEGACEGLLDELVAEIPIKDS